MSTLRQCDFCKETASAYGTLPPDWRSERGKDYCEKCWGMREIEVVAQWDYDEEDFRVIKERQAARIAWGEA